MMRRLGVAFFVMLSAGSAQASPVNWSPATSACTRLFHSWSAADLATAQHVFKSSPEAIQRLTIPDALVQPRLIALVGGPASGKTFSLTDGLFPLLHSRQVTVARFNGHDMNTLTDPYGHPSRPPHPRYLKRADRLLTFDLLAIDETSLPALDVAGRKNLSRILLRRFENGLTTILIARNADSFLSLDELLQDIQFQGQLEIIDFGNEPKEMRPTPRRDVKR